MTRTLSHALPGAALALLLAGCASTVVPADAPSDKRSAAGYGVLPPSHASGAVSDVDTDDVSQVSAQTLEDLLVGRVAGLRIETLPGGRQQVIIRGRNSIYGSNEPLYVVDGVPLMGSAGGLYGINPADVESIRVIKDGQAALYGARGANGVILVTTKRGGE